MGEKTITIDYDDYLKNEYETIKVRSLIDDLYQKGGVIEIERGPFCEKYSISTKNEAIITIIKNMSFFDLMKIRHSKKGYEVLS